MNYALTIYCDTADDLKRAAELLEGFHTEQPKRNRKPQKEDTAADEDDDNNDDAVTLEDVQSVLEAKVADGHRDKVVALLKKYKAKKLTELDEDKYGDFLNDLNKIK